MSTYPILNGRPIDHWMVPELKDELQRRNLPSNGLKDDLVKRLFESIQGEILDDGVKTIGDTPLAEELKGGETPASVDASVYQASVEQSVNECTSEVMEQGTDLAISVTEAINDSVVDATEDSQEATIVTAETTQRTLDAVTEVESSLAGMTATDGNHCETNGDGLESGTSGNNIMKEANSRSECHDYTTEKTPEEDTRDKMAFVDVPSDVTSTDISLGAAVDSKMLEQDAISTPPDAIMLHAEDKDTNDVAAAEPEGDTSKKMAIDDLLPDVTCANVRLTVDADCKIEQQEVPTLPDVIAVHADSKDIDIVATAEGMTRHDNFSGDTSISTPLDPIMLDAGYRDINDVAAAEPEDDTSKKMAIDDLLPDVTCANARLTVDANCNIEQQDVPTLPEVIAAHADGKDVDIVATAEGMTHNDNFSGDTSISTPLDPIMLDAGYRDTNDVAAAEPEHDTNTKIAVDDSLPDVTRANVRLTVDANCKIEQQDVPTLPDVIAVNADGRDADIDATAEDITFSDNFSGDTLISRPPSSIMLNADHRDTNDVAATEPEDDTSKKMAIDDVLPDVIHVNVRLTVGTDCNIEQPEVPTPRDVTAVHADGKDAGIVATAESMTCIGNFGGDTLMYGKDHEDPNSTNGDYRPILCGKKDQVSEINPDLGSQVKCVPIFHDKISSNENNNVKDNLNAESSDLEVEAKKEMVKPSSTIPSVDDCLQALDGDKGLHKNVTSLQELGFTSNSDLGGIPNVYSPENLNLDRIPVDESVDRDVTENKHSASNIKYDDLRGKTEVASENVLKEATPLDTVDECSSAHKKEVMAEENPPILTEKRKAEGHEIIANKEPIKRRRRWSMDTVNIAGQQASKLTGSGTLKEVFQPSLKRSFGRSDSTASGDSPKERIVPPSKIPATTSLRIDRFVRPFTLKAVQELLGKTGSVCSFWMDHIKTHCYVTYSSVEEALATRNAVYNLQWPPNNSSCLLAEFVDPQEVKFKLEPSPPSLVPVDPSTMTAPRAAPLQQSDVNQAIPPHTAATSRGLLPTPTLLHMSLLPTSDPNAPRERLPPHPKSLQEPTPTLDELFKKTQAFPRIYYMPLSEEEVSAKLAVAARVKVERGL